jgi:hypothetical protein
VQRRIRGPNINLASFAKAPNLPAIDGAAASSTSSNPLSNVDTLGLVKKNPFQCTARGSLNQALCVPVCGADLLTPAARSFEQHSATRVTSRHAQCEQYRRVRVNTFRHCACFLKRAERFGQRALYGDTVMLYVTFSENPAPTPDTKPPPNLMVCFPGDRRLSMSQ